VDDFLLFPPILDAVGFWNYPSGPFLFVITVAQHFQAAIFQKPHKHVNSYRPSTSLTVCLWKIVGLQKPALDLYIETLQREPGPFAKDHWHGCGGNGTLGSGIKYRNPMQISSKLNFQSLVFAQYFQGHDSIC
jgi:hypothetical protein